MDTDDGVEVVWNEVRYSNRKSGRKEMLVKILQRLTEFKHTNIVNFINFWHDRVDNQDRVSWPFTVVCVCVYNIVMVSFVLVSHTPNLERSQMFNKLSCKIYLTRKVTPFLKSYHPFSQILLVELQSYLTSYTVLSL